MAQSPTVTTPAVTGAGVILGTAAYMSPEQTKGRPTDKRSDIWSFGAVLYEMLAGRRAFDGEDVSDTLANVLKTEPDWNALPPSVPSHVRTLVQRCLAKDRRDRIADISVALFVLAGGVGTAASVGAEQRRSIVPTPMWRRLVVPIAALLAGAAAARGTCGSPTVRTRHASVRFALLQTGASALQVDAQSRDLALTPDGALLIYKGSAKLNATRLFVRPLDALESTPLSVEGILRAPFVSADGQWVGLVEPSPITLKKVAITGGPILTIATIDGPSRGASWGEDGTIVFATALTATGLQRVSSNGGEPVVLTRPDQQRGEGDHLWPQFLPGGQSVLFTIRPLTGGVDESKIALLDLKNPQSAPRVLVSGGSQAQYVASGHLVYAAAGSLRAVAFDISRGEITGTPVPVVPSILTLPNGTAEYDVARNGTLAYVTGGNVRPQRTLVWVDRQGVEEPVKGIPVRGYAFPRVSPDGTRLALDIRDQENDIWVWDLARETLTRVSTDPDLDQTPEWMPDGRSLVFTSSSEGRGRLLRQAVEGTSPPELLLDSPNGLRVSAVAADGTQILFSEANTASGLDVHVLTLEKDRRPTPLLKTRFVERNAEVSPNGRWVAYESNDSARLEISVRPFPDVTGGRSQVSTGGGAQAHWSRNGDELFFVAPDGALMGVRVGGGTTWTASAPAKLIEGRSYYRGDGTNTSRTYDVSPDGKRFLMVKDATDQAPATPLSVVVVQNWSEELKRLVPSKR